MAAVATIITRRSRASKAQVGPGDGDDDDDDEEPGDMADQLGDVLPEALAEAIGDFFDGGDSDQAELEGRSPSDTPVVPVRHTFHVWKVQEAWRGFILFTLSALSWSLLQHNRVDAMFAFDTYRVYQAGEQAVADAAEEGASNSRPNTPEIAENFNAIESMEELVHFMEYGLIRVLDTMASRSSAAVCPECEVGLTAKHGDMFALALNDFVCSDFYSEAGSSDYPTRNCESDDEAWALAPSVVSAPCCANNSLAYLSMLLMAQYAVDGIEEQSAEELAALSADIARQDVLFSQWLDLQLSDDQVRGGSHLADHIIQIIISRDRRMAGVGFKASYIDDEWFPGIVRCWQEIWSQRYDQTYTTLFLMFVICSIIDAVHELQDIYFDFKMLYLQTALHAGYAQHSRLAKFGAVASNFLLKGGLPFLLCVELPSLVLPMLLEIIKHTGALTVIDFNLLVSVTLSVMMARFFQEGQVIPAFRLLVMTTFQAADELWHFSVIMVVILFIATEMHVTIFGVYSSAYETYGEAMLHQFNFFSMGGEFSTEGEYQNSPYGYLFLYLFGQLVLFLVLSQFFIAILVSAWDDATHLKEKVKEDAYMPPGFSRTPHDMRVAAVAAARANATAAARVASEGRKTVTRSTTYNPAEAAAATRAFAVQAAMGMRHAATSMGHLSTEVHEQVSNGAARNIGSWLLFLVTGYSIEAGCIVCHVKHALDHCLTDVGSQLHARRDQAEQLWASERLTLTEHELNELYLFDDQGLVSRKKAATKLVEAGLSVHSVAFVLSMYIGPPAIDGADDDAVATKLRAATREAARRRNIRAEWMSSEEHVDSPLTPRENSPAAAPAPSVAPVKDAPDPSFAPVKDA